MYANYVIPFWIKIHYNYSKCPGTGQKALKYLRPHNAGHFEQTGVAAIGPKWTNFGFFLQLLVQFQIKEGIFYGKN